MSEESAFLEALAHNPAGDTARLVYADWLEEHERPVDAALQRVLACPGDDGMRLAFAAAVEEDVPCPSCPAILSPDSGGAWPCRRCGASEWRERGMVPGDAALAEFVRVQVELAKTPEPMLLTVGGIELPGEDTARYEGGVCVECRKTRAQRVRCRYHTLEKRERESMTSPGIRAWFSLPGLLYSWYTIPEYTPNIHEPGTSAVSGCETWGWTFNSESHGGDLVGANFIEAIPRRGFIESVTCTAVDWVKHAPAIRAAQPVRKVKLTTWDVGYRLMGRPVMIDPTAFNEEYPGIEFEFPPLTPLVTADNFTYQGAYTAP